MVWGLGLAVARPLPRLSRCCITNELVYPLAKEEVILELSGMRGHTFPSRVHLKHRAFWPMFYLQRHLGGQPTVAMQK